MEWKVSTVRLDTIMKLGGLALNVAQDEKVRELAAMIHHGAKRRGLLDAWAPPSAQQAAQSGAISGGGKTTASQPAAKSGPVMPIPFATPPNMSLYGGSGVSKYLTWNNAKKAMDWAGIVKNILVK